MDTSGSIFREKVSSFHGKLIYIYTEIVAMVTGNQLFKCFTTQINTFSFIPFIKCRDASNSIETYLNPCVSSNSIEKNVNALFCIAESVIYSKIFSLFEDLFLDYPQTIRF